MLRSAVALLSLFFAVAATMTTTTVAPSPGPTMTSNPSLTAQQINDLLAFLRSMPNTNTNTPTSQTPTNTGTNTNPLHPLMGNPFLLTALGDFSKKLAMLTLTGNRLPGSMASRLSLIEGGLGEYLKTYQADLMIQMLAPMFNMDPRTLAFIMTDMPDGYAMKNALFNSPLFSGGIGVTQQQGMSGSGTDPMTSNMFFPAMFLTGN